jgi:hypothetical protein
MLKASKFEWRCFLHIEATAIHNDERLLHSSVTGLALLMSICGIHNLFPNTCVRCFSALKEKNKQQGPLMRSAAVSIIVGIAV